MANLVSPGVQVSVTDESVYGPAGSGTVPMLFIATGQDKVDPTGTETDGIAKYTKSANAGKPVLVTSQRELTQYFGEIDFRTVGGAVVQGDETNEYGLLAAYSFLGQSSAAYIVRADVNSVALRPVSAEPKGPAANNTYWTNPSASKFGIFENDGQDWNAITPVVEITSGGAPTSSGTSGDYLVAIVNGATETEIEYYKHDGSAWNPIVADITFAPHYAVPATSMWVKTTTPGGGLDLDTRLYTTSAGSFVEQQILYAQDFDPTGSAADILHDGSANSGRTLLEGDLALIVDVASGKLVLKRWDSIQNEWDNVGTDASASTGGYVMNIATAMPVGTPANGTYWFDDALNSLDIFEVAMNGSDQEWKKVEHVLYGSAAPLTNSSGGALADGDYWVDTNESAYPVIYRYNGSAWIAKNNTDQSTPDGVVFGDITADAKAANSFVGSADIIADGPDPLFYPVGMSAINMCRSANTVRVYDASATTSWKWRNAASNAITGEGSFGSKAQRKVIVMGMQASFAHEQLREETIQFRLLAAPGYPELMDEMTTLNADRNETAFIIIDTPFKLNPTEAIQWVNGAGAAENGVDGLVSKNAYAAAYYPPVLATDPVSGASVIAPASHSALYTYAYSDNVSFQWFAPAGLTRGIVQNASNVGYLNSEGEFTPVSLTQGHRDVMYEAELNPIANLPGDGVIVYGQKTLSPVASALDRVNVARLTAYLRERFAIIGRPFLFEQNDTQTRANAASTFNGFLANILAQRGVYDYAVVCDETNNTPARIDRNELYIDVAVEPTKSAEFIYIPVRIVNTGELS